MIRKIEEVLAQLQEVGIDQYGYEVLSLWGKEIINECANEAKKLAYPGTGEMTGAVISITVKELIK